MPKSFFATFQPLQLWKQKYPFSIIFNLMCMCRSFRQHPFPWGSQYNADIRGLERHSYRRVLPLYAALGELLRVNWIHFIITPTHQHITSGNSCSSRIFHTNDCNCCLPFRSCFSFRLRHTWLKLIYTGCRFDWHDATCQCKTRFAFNAAAALLWGHINKWNPKVGNNSWVTNVILKILICE